MGTITRTLAVTVAAAAALMSFPGGAHALKFPNDPPPVSPPIVSGPTAPTADIGAVASAITYQAKSVTTVVKVPAGIAISRNVNISVGYSSGTRITQDYVPSTGNRFLYNFPAYDGQPRPSYVSITLSQTDPQGGTPYTLSLNWNLTITPLYDVQFGALKFKLLTDGDWVGKSEILLDWIDPAKTWHQASFSLRAGESYTVGAFASTWSEVAATSPLVMPKIFFSEDDPGDPYGFEFLPGQLPSGTSLVPGTTKVVDAIADSLDQECIGEVTYSQTYTLRWYPYL
jgi:hypothetical protein